MINLKKKINEVLSFMFPYKKVNIFIISFFFLSFILGAIYSNMISIEDEKIVIDKISSFINKIDSNSLFFLASFKNSISINFSYLFLICFFGMTILGIILNIFLLFLKGFIIGFSLSSFIITYGYKGVILSSIYLLFGQLLNIFIILSMSSYAIIFTLKLTQLIFKQKNLDFKKNIKLYFLIFIILIILSFVSSFMECYFMPAVIKLFIKLFA